MSKDTGGPAYPRHTIERRPDGHGGIEITELAGHEGMTWLDAAALTAMQGILAQKRLIGVGIHYAEDAETAYDIAEAMLAEKRRREQG